MTGWWSCYKLWNAWWRASLQHLPATTKFTALMMRRSGLQSHKTTTTAMSGITENQTYTLRNIETVRAFSKTYQSTNWNILLRTREHRKAYKGSMEYYHFRLKCAKKKDKHYLTHISRPQGPTQTEKRCFPMFLMQNLNFQKESARKTFHNQTIFSHARRALQKLQCVKFQHLRVRPAGPYTNCKTWFFKTFPRPRGLTKNCRTWILKIFTARRDLYCKTIICSVLPAIRALRQQLLNVNLQNCSIPQGFKQTTEREFSTSKKKRSALQHCKTWKCKLFPARRALQEWQNKLFHARPYNDCKAWNRRPLWFEEACRA